VAVSDRIPAVTGNRSGMWRGAQALRQPLKISGPPLPSSSTGWPWWVRGTSGRPSPEAEISNPLKYPPDALDFPCENKGFALHNSLHPKEGEVIDIKESFPI
jgi:hypothetical protein